MRPAPPRLAPSLQNDEESLLRPERHHIDESHAIASGDDDGY
jgi:hypothetical protein